MSDLAIVLDLDAENPTLDDLRLVDGQLALTTNVEAVRQALLIRLRTFRGEWHIDQRVGVPWMQSIIGQRPLRTVLDRIFRRAILATPGIVSVEALNFTEDPERSLRIDLEATATGGEVIAIQDFVLPIFAEVSP